MVTVRPVPSPLPRGEAESSSASMRLERDEFRKRRSVKVQSTVTHSGANGITRSAPILLPRLGVPAGVGAAVALDSKPPVSDFLLWQLVDSAFPTGGFAHSSGLEAAWQHGEVRNRDALAAFLDASLHQLGHAALPFVTAAHAEPGRLAEFDQRYDSFTTNHVANRASRTQGRAFLSAMGRIFPERGVNVALSPTGDPALSATEVSTPIGHYAPVFGAGMRGLDLSLETTARMYFFNHFRGVLAAAVRLNIIGPMEAQQLQLRFSGQAEGILQRCRTLTLDEIGQPAPLLDLWQGAQDRLYSRLFQS